jgi:P-type Cu+ transporter
MAIDPICRMTVDPGTELRAERDGETFYFCCERCRQKFLHGDSAPAAQLHAIGLGAKPAEIAKLGETRPLSGQSMLYYCPMHPEVEQNHPGACPKCGMALEPKQTTADGAEDDGELREMTRRFFIALALGVPVILLAMSGMVHLPFGAWLAPAVGWVQLLLATPVVFWAGWPFFERAWQRSAIRTRICSR